MKKKGHTPITRVKNPEPNVESPDWVIWAAWADRITFEEIEKKTGYKESDVIKIMRRSLKPSSFRLWRKRVNQKSIKHRKKFEYSRKKITRKIKKGDYEIELSSESSSVIAPVSENIPTSNKKISEENICFMSFNQF